MEISKELGYVKCVSYDLSFFHFQINVESSSRAEKEFPKHQAL